MNRMNSIRRLASVALVSALVFSALPASAQDQPISAEHLKAARAAITAIKATDAYDGILPEAAGALKQTLIQKNPDLQDVITRTVDEKTLALATRRADLEKVAAEKYASAFSIDELNSIASFYASPAGQKLIADGPIVLREVAKAAEIWQRGVARDLAVEVGKTLDALVASNTPTAPAPVTTEGQPPAGSN